MSKLTRIAFIVMAVAAVTLAIGIKLRNSSTAKVIKEDALVVHEWGTFTSIAGKDGVALEWRPLNGASDLPKFVHTIQNQPSGLRHPEGKGDTTAAIRMETPVLYFYSSREMNVSAKVDFPRGKITEWYPLARKVSSGIDWGTVKVTPGAPFNLVADYSTNHYYAARETDAAPIQVCATNGKPAEQEKFLFYRGVGNFDLPLSVKLEKGQLTLRDLAKEPIARVIIFENQNGRIGYRILDQFSGEVVAERPAPGQKIESLIQELKQTLVASGLYEKEADAMIKTWRDSWFEEGMRVFYVLPRSITESVLPLTINPKPSELVRVLVGRTEVITPEMQKNVRAQVNLLNNSSPAVRDEARRAILKYGRFSEPILKQMIADEQDPAVRGRLQRLIKPVGS
jgi:hypothetical protein